MRIGIVAPPWIAVPPKGYGGTEAVIDTLARGLVAAGHEVRLFTVGESTCSVPRSWRYAAGVVPMNTSLEEAAHVLAAYDELRAMDVIHDHTTTGMLIAGRAGASGPPVVTTYHNAFTADARAVLRRSCEFGSVVAISRSHARTAGDVPVAAVITHGIDLGRHPFGSAGGGGGYLAYLGRMTADKGVDRAVELARRDGRPLALMVKMRTPEEHAFYEARVRPRLRSRDAVFIEPPRAALLSILGHADALLNPIRWAEPFGLAMVEAQACGTPVVATPCGAAPELVSPGVTGFLASSDEELLASLRAAKGLSRRDCREWVADRFSAERMVRDYVALYRRLLRHCRPAPAVAMAGPVVLHRQPPAVRMVQGARSS